MDPAADRGTDGRRLPYAQRTRRILYGRQRPLARRSDRRCQLRPRPPGTARDSRNPGGKTVTATAAIPMREAFGQALGDLAESHPEMMVLDADVSASSRSVLFGKRYPNRFFNVGVAEANMIDIAAGMATCGLRPVVHAVALFVTLKGADQIRNVISYNIIPVILAGTYAGLSDSFDGPSHQSVMDVAIMRAMPNVTVVVPADNAEARQALAAALRRSGPTYIRICRNPTPSLFEGAP